ncbi:hypothetical protein Tco_1326888 [Tanacetum coccineum]
MGLMTPDLICPSTYQPLRSSSYDFGLDMSFDMSALPEYLSGLARASLEEVLSLSSFSYFLAMSKNDIKSHLSTLPNDDLGDLVKTFRILLNLNPRLPDPTLTMDRLPNDTIGIVPTVMLFCMFQILCKQGDCFSFAKRQSTEDVCMDDGPSNLKKWKNKFFLIHRRAILDYLTWIHSHSCVSNDLPVDSYNQNDAERLCSRDHNSEMSIYDFVTLPTWGYAKVVEEPHHLPAPLFDRVSPHTTAQLCLPKDPSKGKARSSLASTSEPNKPSKKRKLRRSALEVGSMMCRCED